MRVSMMKSKLHRGAVTQVDAQYEGSISVDSELLEAAGIRPYERVDVMNITNGARFTTYAIIAPPGSRVIGINGAAARLAQVGDRVTILSYGEMESDETAAHKPTVVLLGTDNTPSRAHK